MGSFPFLLIICIQIYICVMCLPILISNIHAIQATRLKMLILAIILTVSAQVLSLHKNCDGVLIDGVMHAKQVLKQGVDSPYQFTIDYNSNTLFFSYSTHEKDSRFKSAFINLSTGEFNTISSLIDGFASAVDQQNKNIYIGGKGGIYNFNLKTKETTHLTVVNQNIWQMFYRDNLYYTTYPTEEAYLYKDGTSKRLHELSGTRAMLIAVGRNENIYFSNSSGLFEYDKSKKVVMQLGEYVVNGMNADANGKVYFSSPDGIFVIDDKQNTVKRIVRHGNIYAAAVEKDGTILYGTEDSIVRILKTADQCNN